MSGGGSSGSATSTTTTRMPTWETPYAQNFLGQVSNQVLPNGQVAPYNPNLNQQVAPFSQAQSQALNLGMGQTGNAQSLANLGAGTQAAFAGGAFTGPNPYLNQYYNQAAQQVGQQYSTATQPALQAQAEQAGAFNSSGYNQAQGLAQYGLGQSLATLGANIYEPAYQQGMQNQLNAAQNIGTGISNLYQPTQQLYGLGSAQQQQQQNQLNANQQNAAQQANWPFNLLSQLGGALGQAGGGAGTTVSTGPAPSGGK